MVDGMSDMGTTELGAASTPEQARAAFRDGLVRPTCGIAQGYAQANLMILPKEQAFDFLLFAQRNPKPCPLLEVMEPGVTALVTAPGADIRTDVPLYRVWKRGELVAEVPDIREYWRSDLVTFVIGCSFTFEFPLMEAGVPVRHITAGRNVPMYDTSIECRSAGAFHSTMSCRCVAFRLRRWPTHAGFPAITRPCTVPPYVWASRPRSASTTSCIPTMAMPPCWSRAMCRCSGRAA